MGSAGRSYLDEVLRILGEVQDTQQSAIDAAAELVAKAVFANGLVHLFGTGHSHMLAEELFYRAGGLAQVNPILVDPLMLHAGAARSTRLERLTGLAEELIAAEQVAPDDVMIIISNSGGNATCIEMALAARARGVATVALTSISHATSSNARVPGGRHLHDVVDVVLDNKGRVGDACVTLTGLDQAVGPTSTTIGSAMLNAVVTQAVALLVARGHTPDIFASSNVVDGDHMNEALIERYRPRVRSL